MKYVQAVCALWGRYRQVLRECTVQDVLGLLPAEAASRDALQRSAHCRLADSADASESPGESCLVSPLLYA